MMKTALAITFSSLATALLLAEEIKPPEAGQTVCDLSKLAPLFLVNEKLGLDQNALESRIESRTLTNFAFTRRYDHVDGGGSSSSSSGGPGAQSHDDIVIELFNWVGAAGSYDGTLLYNKSTKAYYVITRIDNTYIFSIANIPDLGMVIRHVDLKAHVGLEFLQAKDGTTILKSDPSDDGVAETMLMKQNCDRRCAELDAFLEKPLRAWMDKVRKLNRAEALKSLQGEKTGQSIARTIIAEETFASLRKIHPEEVKNLLDAPLSHMRIVIPKESSTSSVVKRP